MTDTRDSIRAWLEAAFQSVVDSTGLPPDLLRGGEPHDEFMAFLEQVIERAVERAVDASQIPRDLLYSDGPHGFGDSEVARRFVQREAHLFSALARAGCQKDEQ